jgi:hypothetical protein
VRLQSAPSGFCATAALRYERSQFMTEMVVGMVKAQPNRPRQS